MSGVKAGLVAEISYCDDLIEGRHAALQSRIRIVPERGRGRRHRENHEAQEPGSPSRPNFNNITFSPRELEQN